MGDRVVAVAVVEAVTAVTVEAAIEDGKNLINDSQGRDPIAPLF